MRKIHIILLQQFRRKPDPILDLIRVINNCRIGSIIHPNILKSQDLVFAYGFLQYARIKSVHQYDTHTSLCRWTSTSWVCRWSRSVRWPCVDNSLLQTSRRSWSHENNYMPLLPACTRSERDKMRRIENPVRYLETALNLAWGNHYATSC